MIHHGPLADPLNGFWHAEFQVKLAHCSRTLQFGSPDEVTNGGSTFLNPTAYTKTGQRTIQGKRLWSVIGKFSTDVKEETKWLTDALNRQSIAGGGSLISGHLPS